MEQLQKAVGDSAAASSALWISNLFVMFYIAIAAGAVTDADLFVENSVKLPFLNVELSLLAFFALSPIIFLISHSYTLVHIVLLSGKIGQFNAELRRQLPDQMAQRANIRRLLPSNIFVQLLAGPPEVRGAVFGLLLKLIAWSTLIVGPVLLLILIQIQFLPYHSVFIIWIQRLCLFLDIALLWLLWPAIMNFRTQLRWPNLFKAKLPLCWSLAALVFSWGYVCFPGEIQQSLWDRIEPEGNPYPRPIAKSLNLVGFNIYNALKVKDPRDIAWRGSTFDAGGRDLRGADFSRATLERVNFDSARLDGADFSSARLLGASFSGVHFPGTNFSFAFSPGAIFDSSNLQGAEFMGTDLQGATFVETKLQGAQFLSAQLQGASFESADLTGARFTGSALNAAAFPDSTLTGTSFYAAYLQGADFSGTPTSRKFAQDLEVLESSDRLNHSKFFGAKRPPSLIGTDFTKAYLWQVVLPEFSEGDDWLNEARFSDAVWSRDYRTPDGRTGKWSADDYASVARMLDNIPPGPLRTNALNRIALLSCGSTLSTSDPCIDGENPQHLSWRSEIERHKTANYNDILTAALSDYFCNDLDKENLYGLFGIVGHRFANYSLKQAGKSLLDRVLGEDCSLELTEQQKKQLNGIRYIWVEELKNIDTPTDD
ncbi:pentapeptide repeat-containing protein [Rhizobium ruizarguesonis]|uniref:pentapeptide repeat-containing protein n=1 Tax=Rhizobium ruizarguesonis TaxID=2081791 RepID=UPI001031A92E|nr:pentapeptide repeat-containing protein [Rhizobium ruizarguesonis]TAU35391.1 pentapeptide repeat-containing protein [Rhizobium ruizarguesonis]TAU45875.1 pentapeptide repeat-containing protein [Rhizobium ruizarguesonis]